MHETWVVYVVLAAVLAVALLLLWALSKRKRSISAPEEAKPEKSHLELVPPERKGAAVVVEAPPEARPKGKGLKEGLEKTRGGFVARIGSLIGKKEIDKGLVDQLEEILFTADIGTKTAHKLFESVKGSLSRNELKDADAVWGVIRRESEAILARAQAKAGPLELARTRPFVVLTIGVNGVGKTTTIGKLAAKWTAEGRKVLLAAGDTFRAAA